MSAALENGAVAPAEPREARAERALSDLRAWFLSRPYFLGGNPGRGSHGDAEEKALFRSARDLFFPRYHWRETGLDTATLFECKEREDKPVCYGRPGDIQKLCEQLLANHERAGS